MRTDTIAQPKRLMISPDEAAQMLSVDRSTILRWIRAGKLGASRLSPRILRVKVADIEAMLERGAF